MTAIYFEQEGTRADMVLVHGWGLHGGIFRSLAEQLAREFRVTMVDLPGHGRSSATDHNFDLNKTADMLAKLIGKPAVWLGWSLGGVDCHDHCQPSPTSS